MKVVVAAFTVGGSLAVTACATLQAEGQYRPLAYGCRDLVVEGRTSLFGYDAIEDEQDLIGHGVYSITVTIRRVLQGRESRRQVLMRYAGHGQMREDLDFLLVLEPVTGGAYRLRTGAVLGNGPRPRLAPRCSDQMADEVS